MRAGTHLIRFATLSSSRRTAFSNSVSSGGGYGGHVFAGICNERFEVEGISMDVLPRAQAVGSEERKDERPWAKLKFNYKRAGGSDGLGDGGRVA